jgi:hypothetical protein
MCLPVENESTPWHNIHNMCRTCVHRKKLFEFLKYNDICSLTAILNELQKSLKHWKKDFFAVTEKISDLNSIYFYAKTILFLGLLFFSVFWFVKRHSFKPCMLHFQLNYECDVTGRNFHKLPINKIKGYLYSILSLSGQSSGSPYRVRQIMVLIKTVLKTKCPLFYI